VSSRPLSATFSEGESGDGYNKSSGVGCDLRGSILFFLTLVGGGSIVITISLFFVVFVVLRVFFRLSCGGVVNFLLEGLLLDILPYGADWLDVLDFTERPQPSFCFASFTVCGFVSLRSGVLGEEAKDGFCFGSIVLERQLHVRVRLVGLEVPEPVSVRSEPAGSFVRRVAHLLPSFAVDPHCLLVGNLISRISLRFETLEPRRIRTNFSGGFAFLVALNSRSKPTRLRVSTCAI